MALILPVIPAALAFAKLERALSSNPTAAHAAAADKVLSRAPSAMGQKLSRAMSTHGPGENRDWPFEAKKGKLRRTLSSEETVQVKSRFKWLKVLMWVGALGAGTRLMHAWGVFAEMGNVWPAGGIPDYIQQANPSQWLVTIHVSLCSLWTLCLFYQFYTGLGSAKVRGSHVAVGYLAVAIASVAAASGWSAVWSLRVPSFVTPFIKAQLFVGAPGFLAEAMWGIWAMVQHRDWEKHRKHMTLSMIGTLADAGNGFSISVSRWLFAGTPYQQWGQDVGVLSLNVISILPFLVPGLGPHYDHLASRDWKALRQNFFGEFCMWDYAAIVTVVGGTCLMISNLCGLYYLFTIRPWLL